MTSFFDRLRVNGLDSPTGVTGPDVRLAWVPTGLPMQDGGASRTDKVGTVCADEGSAGWTGRNGQHGANGADPLRQDVTVVVAVASSLDDLAADDPARLLVRLDGLPPSQRCVTLPLPDRRLVYWRVGASSGGETVWSETQRFATAPDLTALGAQWITHPDLRDGRALGDYRSAWFATRIDVRPGETICLIHLATPGLADVRVDGRPVGRLLGPGYCDLRREIPAATYDAGALAEGPHLVTIEIAPGPFWIPVDESRYTKFTGCAQAPKLLAAIEQLGDVHRLTVSGDAFRCGRGATTETHWYGGEDYNAALPEPWDGMSAILAADQVEQVRQGAAGESSDRESLDVASSASFGGCLTAAGELLGTAILYVPAPDAQVWWPQYPPITVSEILLSQVSKLSEGGPVADPAGHPLWSEVTNLSGGRFIADSGVNVAGWPSIRWEASDRPRTVTLLPAENVGADGVVQSTTGRPVFDTLHIPADHAGSWHPRFTYHGFRYLEMRCDDGDGRRGRAAIQCGDGQAQREGSDNRDVSRDSPVMRRDSDMPTVGTLVLRASNARAGTFHTSDPFLDALHRATDRAIQSNMASVFTDCPHREKLGWLEQLHLCFDALARNWDVEAHLRDVLHHVRQAQLPNGDIPSIAPEFVDFTGADYLGDPEAFRFDVNWGGVIVLLPLAHYRQYGDRRVIDENLAAMKRYLARLTERERDGSFDFGLSDWLALDERVPRRLVATYGYWRVLRAATDIAVLVGDEAWEQQIQDRLAAVTSALRRFAADARVDATQTELVLLADVADALDDVAPGQVPDAGADCGRHQVEPLRNSEMPSFAAPRILGQRRACGDGTTSALMPEAGGVPGLNRSEPADECPGSVCLFDLLMARLTADGAFTVGEIGIGPLLDVLHRHGRDDLIYRVISRTDVPGYGMQLAKGATALSETWSGEPGQGGQGEGSNNHFMLGMIDHWLHRQVAGLRQADGSVAWQHAVVEPVFLAGVASASSTHLSPIGTYGVAWERLTDNQVAVTVEVPPGGGATACLPGVPVTIAGAGCHRFVVTDPVSTRSTESGTGLSRVGVAAVGVAHTDGSGIDAAAADEASAGPAATALDHNESSSISRMAVPSGAGAPDRAVLRRTEFQPPYEKAEPHHD